MWKIHAVGRFGASQGVLSRIFLRTPKIYLPLLVPSVAINGLISTGRGILRWEALEEKRLLQIDHVLPVPRGKWNSESRMREHWSSALMRRGSRRSSASQRAASCVRYPSPGCPPHQFAGQTSRICGENSGVTKTVRENIGVRRRVRRHVLTATLRACRSEMALSSWIEIQDRRA
jgi:hypothetical protein